MGCTLVSLLLLVFAAGAVLARRRKRERESWFYTGRCTGCGYDLRGSADRCPECGRGIWQ